MIKNILFSVNTFSVTNISLEWNLSQSFFFNFNAQQNYSPKHHLCKGNILIMEPSSHYTYRVVNDGPPPIRRDNSMDYDSVIALDYQANHVNKIQNSILINV